MIQYKVHHSRVLRFIGVEMPYYEAIAEQQWGTSAIEAMFEFKLPPLAEMTPDQKAEIVDKQSQYLERLFQAGVLPADSLLNGVRNAQTEVGITSTITDDDVESMKGKYMKDLAPQTDPFGGVFNGEEESTEPMEVQQEQTQQEADRNNG